MTTEPNFDELAKECIQGIIDTNYPCKEVFVQNSVKEKFITVLQSAYRDGVIEGLEIASNIRPPRSMGTPPNGLWGGWYEVGWNNGVVSYSKTIDSEISKRRENES